jgi:hypothetical protein
MSRYLLIDCETGKAHDLDFENIVDIQAALSETKKLRNAGQIPSNLECLPETIEKMSKVDVPITDY